MKELSIEEKARRYDEAKYIMKEYLESGNAGVIAENTIKKAFPELKESGDERIRKELIKALETCKWCGNKYWSSNLISIDDAIAWLEKQGEQKPDTNCLLSWSETDEKMLQSLEGIVKVYWAKAEQEKNEIKIREASNVSYFLKTIQKSPLCWIKCSDGLPNRDGIYLVVTDGLHNEVYDMARYDSIEGWHKASEIIYWMPIPQLNNKSIIEQKSADNIEKPWSEDDNKHFERILKELENQWQRPSNRPYLDEIVSDYYWLNSIKDRVQSQWKPSDEQMEALLSKLPIIKGSGDEVQDILESLYQDLEKLREE